MPGPDTDLAALGLDALPARLARLLLIATEAVERQAQEGAVAPDALARSVGVLARAGAGLAACMERIGRLRAAAAGDTDATEEADMDDAEHTGAYAAALGPMGDADRLERGLRNLARNLRIPEDAEDDAGGDGAEAAGRPAGGLAGAGRGAPVAA